uniref:Coiled-coil-helix-coiled-coil-helix domain containing 6b n=1 Tax=Gasterosteus aculeatus aculeatus TaxID=481459 RepID=G3NZR5_GASAC
MGGNGSTSRKVSFGLDENEKVTVMEGVKLSNDVLRRMRDSQGTDGAKPHKPPPSKSKSPFLVSQRSHCETHCISNFERHQALVQEQLARLAQKERETAGTQGLGELTPALLMEKGKAHEEQEKAKILPADVDAWEKQLSRKENELASISSFYKEQLEILEKKNFDNYKQTSEQYNEAATRAEAHIRPRQTASVCTELQAKVLQGYRENPQQTLHCSGLA